MEGRTFFTYAGSGRTRTTVREHARVFGEVWELNECCTPHKIKQWRFCNKLFGQCLAKLFERIGK